MEYGLGNYKNWHFDQLTEKLQFLNESQNPIVEANVIVIGSYMSESNSWKWAWANESFTPTIREKSKLLIGLTELTGIGLFSEEETVFVEDESMAWELGAFSVKYLSALGLYRIPSKDGNQFIYLSLTSLIKIK
jgi:hypothetical protein